MRYSYVQEHMTYIITRKVVIFGTLAHQQLCMQCLRWFTYCTLTTFCPPIANYHITNSMVGKLSYCMYCGFRMCLSTFQLQLHGHVCLLTATHCYHPLYVYVHTHVRSVCVLCVSACVHVCACVHTRVCVCNTTVIYSMCDGLFQMEMTVKKS